MESNVQKMREALREALEEVNKIYDILSKPCIVIEDARQACREARGVLIPALDKPPRNCDRFKTADEAWNAYDEWVESFRMNRRMPPYNVFGWLFATSETKGGTDGQ